MLILLRVIFGTPESIPIIEVSLLERCPIREVPLAVLIREVPLAVVMFSDN